MGFVHCSKCGFSFDVHRNHYTSVCVCVCVGGWVGACMCACVYVCVCALRSYLIAFNTSRSACFPTSIEPYLSDSPREAAAFIVDAISASGIVMYICTQARCITIGCRRDMEGNKL